LLAIAIAALPALALAGTGKANPSSLIAALELARQLAAAKAS
jgi:4-hydroxy-L-threonine phosphate dehydrogenase PdxA